MRSILLIGIACLLLPPAWHAQSPADGHIEGGVYVNSYFHISYAWPQMLQPFDTGKLPLAKLSPDANEFLLFAARQGEESYGVLMLAVRLNAKTPHSSGIKDGADFLDRAQRSFDPGEKPHILTRKHFKNADGLDIDELDYVIDGEYSSGIAANLGQFLIVFKCNAKSAADLAAMTQSAVNLHLQK